MDKSRFYKLKFSKPRWLSKLNFFFFFFFDNFILHVSLPKST